MANQVMAELRNNLALYKGLPPITGGRQELKYLTPQHKTIIMMHLEGYERHEISDTLQCAYEKVCFTLRSAVAKEHIDDFHNFRDREAAALYSIGLREMRGILRNGDNKEKIRAFELLAKSQGKFEKKDPLGGETAEDILSKVMNTVMDKLQPGVEIKAAGQITSNEDVKEVTNVES